MHDGCGACDEAFDHDLDIWTHGGMQDLPTSLVRPFLSPVITPCQDYSSIPVMITPCQNYSWKCIKAVVKKQGSWKCTVLWMPCEVPWPPYQTQSALA